MPHTSCYIQVGTECLHYLKAGNGRKLLLAFHGYGHDAQSLTLFAPYLTDEYTCLFFDLPHHGKSNWKEYTLFTTRNLSALVQELMQANSVDCVSLLGYSIGGRVCLSIINLLPESIDKVTLLASDGMRVDPYYNFFTRNSYGKRIFNHMLTQPGQYHKLLSVLKKSRLVHEKRYKFAMHYLGDEAARQQLRKVWPSLTELVPGIPDVQKTIQGHKVPVAIFMGRYDKIIPPSVAEKFSKGLRSVQNFILNKGHRIYDTSNAKMIAETLLH